MEAIFHLKNAFYFMRPQSPFLVDCNASTLATIISPRAAADLAYAPWNSYSFAFKSHGPLNLWIFIFLFSVCHILTLHVCEQHSAKSQNK